MSVTPPGPGPGSVTGWPHPPPDGAPGSPRRAYDFLLFTQRNPQPCPVLDVGDPGNPTTALAQDADVRTDLPGYRVWRDGRLVDEPTDVLAHWRDDLVTFHIGCSFTFETALVEHGIPMRHVEQGRNVQMYITRRECRPAGQVHGPMVVSMRPIPADLVGAVVRLSARMPAVHGAPVHVGDPQSLLVGALDHPDFGEPVEFADGDVPVFWACGVTHRRRSWPRRCRSPSPTHPATC
jgi:uncharacterized protein YcsI (UPF0317 family)